MNRTKSLLLGVVLVGSPLTTLADNAIYVVDSVVDVDHADAEQGVHRALQDAGLERAGDQIDTADLPPTTLTFDARVRAKMVEAARRVLSDNRFPNLKARVLRLRAVHERGIRTAFVAPAGSDIELPNLKVRKVADRVALFYQGERMDVAPAELVSLSKPWAGDPEDGEWSAKETSLRGERIHRVVKSWVRAHQKANTLVDTRGTYGLDRDGDKLVDLPLEPGEVPDNGVVTFDVRRVEADGLLGPVITRVSVDLDIPLDVGDPNSVANELDDRQRLLGDKLQQRQRRGVVDRLDRLFR